MNQITEAYNKDPEREWRRLVKDPYHSLEFLVTMYYLRKHLPPQGKILDAGGGPGRYSLELCRAGYEVVLLDISFRCIDTAKDKFRLEPEAFQKRLLEFVVGDVRDLSRFEADSFEAVLCLDPLSYLGEKVDRIRAVSELVRVAKPKGIVCISGRGYLALPRTILLIANDDFLDPSFAMFLETGNIPIQGSMVHFFRADELRQLAESCGLTTLEMAGCEGLSSNLIEATNVLHQDEEKWNRWVELVLQTSAEPSVVDMAEHILYIGRVSESL
jgi:ubiquinone/menaquinone biosynthesis C-methylase UbiE